MLRCHGCNSDTHLIAQCPLRKGKGKGKKGKGKSVYEETEDWGEQNLVEQYEFSYTGYTEGLYGASSGGSPPTHASEQAPVQYFPAILDADQSGQGTHPPAETDHHQESDTYLSGGLPPAGTYYDSDIYYTNYKEKSGFQSRRAGRRR